ncbi:MAG: hypothetical protein LBT80_08065 [Lactobacillaceae bacterium]|nr:hypothetical protein [Lactobacillaceae bacterium]
MSKNNQKVEVRNVALKMAWWVVFAGWFTVLLLVGIGLWQFSLYELTADLTVTTGIAICSTSLATLMLLFDISSRYVGYKVGRAERILNNTQVINARLHQLMGENRKGELVNARDILLELIEIAECIYFQEVDITIINRQYIVFINGWLMDNLELIYALIEWENYDARVLFEVANQLKEVGRDEKKL